MHQLLPKKWEKVESPPKKKEGNKLKKRNIYLTIWPSSKKKKVETNSHRKIPRYKIHDATPVPPCKLVFFATLVPRFVSQALFAWRAPWQKHFQLSFGDLATIWKKTTFGIEWNWGLPDFSPSSFTGNSWTSLTIFEQWDVAVLAMKGGSPHLTTANKIQRFFFQHGQAAFPRQILQILISASTKKCAGENLNSIKPPVRVAFLEFWLHSSLAIAAN